MLEFLSLAVEISTSININILIKFVMNKFNQNEKRERVERIHQVTDLLIPVEFSLFYISKPVGIAPRLLFSPGVTLHN